MTDRISPLELLAAVSLLVVAAVVLVISLLSAADPAPTPTTFKCEPTHPMCHP